jgi:hypothetical protein
MLTHDAASLEQRIMHLSKIRSALVLVLGEIDTELIPLKKARNARLSPIGRLPNELLVRILRLSQISDSGTLNAYNVVPHASWWKVMSVSTHFRSVIMSSPMLWAAFDSRWPQTWSQLCIKRADGCLLSLSIHVDSESSASVACRLLPRSEHAVLTFSSHATPSRWDESYIKALQIDCPALRSLKIEDENWWMPPLVLAPPHLTLCTALSYLDIDATSVVVEDAFSFPPSLRQLRIARLHISASHNRIRRLFAGMPLLEDLEICQVQDMYTPALELIETLDPKTVPLSLPALSSLRLYLDDAPIQLAHAISQVLDVPKLVLKISVAADAGGYASSVEEDAAAELLMTRNLHDYAQRFWTRATGCAQLPPATLRKTRGSYVVEIEGGDPDDAAGISLWLNVASNPRPPSDVFLPLVTFFVVNSNINEALALLGADDWPPPDSLPALETMVMELCDAWRAVDEIQKWVDMQAQHPIVVRFQCLHNDRGMPGFEWSTERGPLKDVVDWGKHITAEDALTESDLEEDD